MGIFDIPGYEGSAGQLLGFGDSAVCQNPTPEQEASIAISACDTWSALTGSEARCALLSFSTDGSGAGEMVQKVRDARDIANERRPDLKIDGEFQLDAALRPEVAAHKVHRESAVAGKASLTTQVEALTNTLAIQCGYTTGTQIETSDLPVVTAEQVTSIDYNKDLAEALKNSYAIYSKEYAMQTASDDYENNKTNTLYAYQAAKIDRDAQKESTTASFRKLYTDLQEKQTALAAADADLAQAKKTFTVSQVQYTRGMISKMAYTDALDTFTTAQETEVAARIDLLTAYNTYQWAKRGVITATT